MPSQSRDVWLYKEGLAPTSQDQRVRDWGNTPGFPLPHKRDLPINPYADLQQKGTQNCPDSLVTNLSSGVTSRFKIIYLESPWEGFKLLVQDDVEDAASLRNKATIKALVKVGDVKANIAVSFKEAAKTSSLIIDRAERLWKAYKAFKRARPREVARHLGLSPGTVHKTWLEYKYGWTPLLMEVKGAAEFFAQQQAELGWLDFAVSAAELDEMVLYDTGPGLNYMGFDSILNTATYTVKGSRRSRVKLWCRYLNPHAHAAQQVGITNPLLYAWEVIPFSFVFDWFLSVGDYLTAQTALQGVQILKAMSSDTLVWDGQVIDSFPGYSGAFATYHPWDLLRTCKGRLYSRSPLFVSPWTLHPAAGNGLNWQKTVTALALLRSNARSLDKIRI